MGDFILAPVARADLHEIWDYYASEIQNVDVADRIGDELFAAFDALAQTPGMGHFRRDLVAEPLRFWRVRDYLIIYRSEKSPIIKRSVGSHNLFAPTPRRHPLFA